MHARRSSQERAKSNYPVPSVLRFSGNGTFLKGFLCILASTIILLFGSNPALSNEIYLFMNPDNNNESSDASNTVANLLGSMLRNEFQGWTIRTVSEDQVTKPTVEEYAAAYDIFWYLKVKVSSTQGGLHVDFVLAARQETYPTYINIGAEKKKDSRIIRFRLRKIPLFYRAMLEGINPANIIYVKCFRPTCEISQPLIPRRLTLQLPARLKETTMNDRYHTTGINHLDFERQCERGQGGYTEEDLRYLEVFKHFIQGFISSIDGEVEVPIHVHSDNRMYTITPPSMPVNSVIDDLAEHIAACWGRWDDPNCQ